MKNINCIIDNIPVVIPEGTTILEAAEKNDIFIPTLCHTDKLHTGSYCYMCVVEIEGESELAPACSTLITNGMIITTDTEKVKTARRTCIELLLSDHRGDCLGPCVNACPAGIDIPGFIKNIACGNVRTAIDLIFSKMPFAGSLGRICNRPCEDACRRQLVDTPIAICHLKRYAFDKTLMSNNGHQISKSPDTGKRIAIIGTGPCGLSAAYFLLKKGHRCVLFEKNKYPGGMLRYGIPSFRLPQQVLNREISLIEKLGAEIHCDTTLGTHFNLYDLELHYDAVFIALGAAKPLKLNIPNETANGIFSAIAFLRDYRNGKVADIGSDVIIIGGGGVAIDAARVARRNGAPVVNIYCLETKDEMPAPIHELEAAINEGILINNRIGIDQIIVNNGKIKGILTKRCLSIFDKFGNFNPQYLDTDLTEIRCDTLIIAAGQQPELTCLEDTYDILMRITEQPMGSSFRRFLVNKQSMQTPIKKIFAGGDCVTGTATAVEAVAAGRKAAVAIDQFLNGIKVTGEKQTYMHSMGDLNEISEKAFLSYVHSERVKMPENSLEKRLSSFNEVETGLTDKKAQEEACRCIDCGCKSTTECKLRCYATLYNADANKYQGKCHEYNRIDASSQIFYDSHRCIQCHICINIAKSIHGLPLMEIIGRGFSTRLIPIQEQFKGMLPINTLINIINHCPTGALSLKSNIARSIELSL